MEKEQRKALPSIQWGQRNPCSRTLPFYGELEPQRRWLRSSPKRRRSEKKKLRDGLLKKRQPLLRVLLQKWKKRDRRTTTASCPIKKEERHFRLRWIISMQA